MANSPFDQRIINQLERPTSSDLNIAQGQINANVRAFARQLLQFSQSNWGTGTGPGGALGNSFIIRAAATPNLAEVTMTRGVGFASFTPSIENIGGITGLSTNLDYPVIYSADRVLALSGVTAPAAGTCRRDVIAIRAIGQSEQGLDDVESTDIYNPSLNAFAATDVAKTLTADLTTQNLEVIESTGTPTGALVYIKGAERPYATPDDLLNAPITTAGSGAGPYNNIAIINRYDGQTEITESDIVDYRLVASPGGQLTITGSANVGALGNTPGAALSSVIIKAPPGIKAAIYKLGANSPTETNTYALIVAGPRTVSSASINFSVGIPAPEFVSDDTWTIYPAQIRTGLIALNQAADNAAVEIYANSSKVVPTQTIAVGQPLHYFPFTLGRMDNLLSSTTLPLTLTNAGTVEIAQPPNFPAAYPADTYNVSGYTNTRTYYLNYDLNPTSPTTGLTSPTWMLGTSPIALESAYTNSNMPDTDTRISGFVATADASITAIPVGIWKLSVQARSDFSAVIKARVYLYDGTQNPESGTLVGESDEVAVYDNGQDNTPPIFLFMRVNQTIVASGRRIYIKLSGRRIQGVTTQLQVFFNGNNPAVLDTNILTVAPTVTIPNPDSDYPAGTYAVSGATGTVTANVAQTLQRFNSKATTFQRKEDSVYQTVPINFTVTLNRS